VWQFFLQVKCVVVSHKRYLFPGKEKRLCCTLIPPVSLFIYISRTLRLGVLLPSLGPKTTFAVMESLLERIEENRLDALYLFINESLRDRVNFDRFFLSLVSLLPLNWSIQRVEIGHEFLSMVEDQLTLFTKIAEMESIRTLIVSDGYVPRKDHGTIHTASLLEALPRARNLTILDVQRLELADADQVQDLADVFETMQESLEEVRITGLHLRTAVSLDPVLTAWIDMSNLRALALSTHPETKVTDSNSMMSQNALKALLQDSTTLQDLTLRSMHLNDDQCQTIAGALNTNSFLTSLGTFLLVRNGWLAG
jgi:hypothetical protein